MCFDTNVQKMLMNGAQMILENKIFRQNFDPLQNLDPSKSTCMHTIGVVHLTVVKVG